MNRTAKNIVKMFLAAAVMLAIVFVLDTAKASAQNKPLARGQYFRIGTCTVPGEGYGENSDYELNDQADTFSYNGEYICDNPSKGSPSRTRYSSEEAYKNNIYITYPAREKRYTSFPGGVRVDIDTPGAYHNGGDYIFYLFVTPWQKWPLQLRCTGENRGLAWGVQIESGDGTREHPYRFGVLYAEPYRINCADPEHGTVDVIANAEAGRTVDVTVKADLGYLIDQVVISQPGEADIPLVPDEYGRCSFEMPESEVSLRATFKAKPGIAGIEAGDGSLALYNSLAAALPDWKDDTTLILYEGVRLDAPITITDKRTLDLNGYVLKAEKNAFAVKNGGSLTLKDSAPDRKTEFEGDAYTGGRLLGSVDGGKYPDYVMAGVIDVADGSFTMESGRLINQFKGEGKGLAISATTGAKVRIKEGYIKAYSAIIMDTKKNVSIQLDGGRYDLNEYEWPVVYMGEGSDYYSAISVTGGYYRYDLRYPAYRPIAEGYRAEKKEDQIDWKYDDFLYRVADERDPLRISIAEEIWYGTVSVSETFAREGDTVKLTAVPEEECYKLKKYIVTDANGGTVKVTDGAFTMPDSDVTVSAEFEEIFVDKIRLNAERITLGEDETFDLTAVPAPANAKDKEINWSSDNTAVATVDAITGKVTAAGYGETVITATALGSGVTAVCTVTVKHKHDMYKDNGREATCTQTGQKECWICVRGDHACGKIFADESGTKEITAADRVIPKDGEKHGQHKGFETTTVTVTARTCTTPLRQNIITTCIDCGSVVSNVVRGEAPLKHNWSDWEEVTPATETEPGEEHRECLRDGCDEEETRAISARDHVHVLTHTAAKARTCEEPGNIEYWECSGGEYPCGHCFADEAGVTEIDRESVITYPKGHRATEEVREKETPATCEAPASYEAVTYCEGCDLELTRAEKTEGSALGHDLSAWKRFDESRHGRTCSRCSYEETAVHAWDDGRTVRPTCIAKGMTVYTCAGCGYKEQKNVVDPDPDAHVFEDPTYRWHDDNKEVTATHTCMYDGAVEEETVDTKVIEAKPTCTEKGSTTYMAIFQNGDFTKQTKVFPGEKAAGHKWDAGKVTAKATADKAGVMTYTCTVCGETKTAAIAKDDTVVKTKKVKLKAAKLRKKKQTVARKKALTLSNAKGAMTYAKGKVTYKKAGSVKMTAKQLKKYRKKAAKKFVINRKTGNITAKKGLKKGTYKLKVTVTCAGDASYAPCTKTVTVTMKVR